MASTSLSQSADHIEQMWDDSTYNSSNNISLMNSLNLVGYKPALPNASYDTADFYLLQNLEGFCHGTGTSRFANECKRTLQSGMDAESSMSNTYVVMYASNYTARGFSLTTSATIFKNGSSQGTCTRTSTLALNSLSVGDVITGTEPFIIYENSFPGQQGLYCGYAGYSFATRRDRQTKKLVVFNPTNKTCQIQLLFTSTSDANVTSMTSLSTSTINSGDIFSTTISTTGNYFLYTSELCVAWQGFSPSGDTIMLYPLSQEPKYGFFSSDGHVFATNNAEASLQNTGGGSTIKGATTAGGSANIISTLGTGDGNAYGCDGVNATLKAGSFFSGNACKVFNDSGVDCTSPGTLFTAESQADGNGSEMTTFTGERAHARGCMSGAGAAWVAIVGAGYSGSTGQDLIMRFNSAGTFQEGKSFSGQTGTNAIKKAYFGNGSGTGISANAGDFFWCTTNVQGYQDTDSTDKDESNMIMTNFVQLPAVNSFVLYGEGYEDCEEACDAANSGLDAFTVYSPSTAMAEGACLFSSNSSTYDSPMNGQTLCYGYLDGRTAYCVCVNYQGIVTSFTAC